MRRQGGIGFIVTAVVCVVVLLAWGLLGWLLGPRGRLPIEFIAPIETLLALVFGLAAAVLIVTVAWALGRRWAARWVRAVLTLFACVGVLLSGGVSLGLMLDITGAHRVTINGDPYYVRWIGYQQKCYSRAIGGLFMSREYNCELHEDQPTLATSTPTPANSSRPAPTTTLPSEPATTSLTPHTPIQKTTSGATPDAPEGRLTILATQGEAGLVSDVSSLGDRHRVWSARLVAAGWEVGQLIVDDVSVYRFERADGTLVASFAPTMDGGKPNVWVSTDGGMKYRRLALPASGLTDDTAFLHSLVHSGDIWKLTLGLPDWAGEGEETTFTSPDLVTWTRS